MRLRKLSIALGASAIGVAALGAIPALGADHRDAPLSKGAPMSDLNDVYAFKAANGNLVLAMTVNPLTSPADTGKLMLDPDTVYEFKIDSNGDAKADKSLKFTVSGNSAVQDFTVRMASGADAVTNDPSGATVATGKTSTGMGVTVATAADGTKYYVGPRDDPFFFDLAGFQAGLKFTGVDTFKGTNITAFVVEVPSSVANGLATGGKLGVWSTTSKRGTLGGWDQIDRMGRPAINTVFIPADQKDSFNSNNPDRDAAIFTDEVKAALNSLASPATDALAGILLPDILTVDLNASTKYLNGRGLPDDVIDISLQAITGSTTIGDGVNANDNAFLAAFPYLAAPNGAPAAPGAPNTGTGSVIDDGNGVNWTLPAGLVAAGVLLAAAGIANRRRVEDRG